MQMPRFNQTSPFIHHQQFKLDQFHPAIADNGLKCRSPQSSFCQQFSLTHTGVAIIRIQRIQYHAAGAAFREWQLIFIDEAAFQRESNQYAEDGASAHPDHHLPPRNNFSGNQHIG